MPRLSRSLLAPVRPALLGDGGSGEDAYSDNANTSEETALQDPGSERSWRFYKTEPLKETVRIAGSAVLDALLKTSADDGQLSPVLVDIDPDGGATTIGRGHLNLQYRDSPGDRIVLRVKVKGRRTLKRRVRVTRRSGAFRTVVSPLPRQKRVSVSARRRQTVVTRRLPAGRSR